MSEDQLPAILAYLRATFFGLWSFAFGMALGVPVHGAFVMATLDGAFVLLGGMLLDLLMGGRR